MKKIYLTVDKEWLLENYPKMTLKEMCDNNITIKGDVYTVEGHEGNLPVETLKNQKKMKHEIYISRNKVKLHGVWAWCFIVQAIIWFIIGIIDIIKWII